VSVDRSAQGSFIARDSTSEYNKESYKLALASIKHHTRIGSVGDGGVAAGSI